MADRQDKNLFPTHLSQNPAPVETDSQDRKDKVREQASKIMQVFLQLLPSNYVSEVTGPFYTIQFQAAAESLAEIQIAAQESFSDASIDYTRSEFLYQILGSLVFPDASTDGYPDLEGDVSFRSFLKRMVELLLGGATKSSVESGLKELSNAVFTVIERGIVARDSKARVFNKSLGKWEEVPGSAWGLDDQFTFEIDAFNDNQFPVEPFTLQENVRIVLRALKPAHTIYVYRNLFKETFGTLFSDTYSMDLYSYYYEDFRRFCWGAERMTGTEGVTLSGRMLFSDPTRDFSSIKPGAVLTILSGANAVDSDLTDEGYFGRHRVSEVQYFAFGDDPTPRPYTTAPTGLTGLATVSGDVITDSSQDWSLAVEGEQITFSSGPNSGASYRLKWLGGEGGPVGDPFGTDSPTEVRIAPSILKLDNRMQNEASGQSYEVTVDRLGRQRPHTVTGEDASAFFIL